MNPTKSRPGFDRHDLCAKYADLEAEVARLRAALRYAAHQIDHVTDHPEWDAVACLRAIAKYARFVATETPKGALTR